VPRLVEVSHKEHQGTWIEIRLDRLKANLKTLRNCQLPGTEVMAVIKANAYGHGALQIARCLEEDAAYFGVSSLREALELRERSVKTPLLVFSRLLGDEIPAALTEEITLSVSSFEEAAEISELSESSGRRTKIHIKVDTGMGRFGIPYGRALKTVEKISGLSGVIPEGIFTHFPTAEKEDGFRDRQVQDFGLLLAELDKKNIRFRYRHGSNSAATVCLKTPIFNMVRPGLMLYGLYPDPSLRDHAPVSPVLSLKSRVILIKRLRAGDTVGYGRDYTASKSTTLGILPIGYSHGYPFRASHKAHVLYRGIKIPLAGRVSMDYITADFGDLPVRVGDEITLIGESGQTSVAAEELADWAGTIPYEVVTGFVPNLSRFYR